MNFFNKADLKNVFERVANNNSWADPESISGPGSNLEQTRIIRKEIPQLITKYKIKSVFDAPCGDLFWMKELFPQFNKEAIQYCGADIVSSLIERHNIHYKNSNISFQTTDLTKDDIPQVDLILTRDCFIHLSYSNIYLIIKNYKKSKSRYLLTNTYTSDVRKNFDVHGYYLDGRMLNMQKFPFYFGKPKELIVEGCTEGNGLFADKSLALWDISGINLSKLKFFYILSLFPTTTKRVYKKISKLLSK